LSTIIKRDFDFLTGVHFEGTYLINQFHLVLTMSVETDSIREQNVAMDRIKYFLYECLENSVMVSEAEKKTTEKYMAAGMKICTLPDEPYDQIVVLVLANKINAICEGRLLLIDIELKSTLSDDVSFVYEFETILVTNPYRKGWWMDSTTNISDIKCTNKKEKIVKLIKSSDWGNVQLDWAEKVSKPMEIIFTPDTEK
jgi:hypothetical protein